MTCLVALRHARGVVLGADSAINNDGVAVRTRKVFRRGQLVLALGGDCSAIDDLLANVPDAPSAPEDFAMWAAYRPGNINGIVACGGEAAEFGPSSCEPVVDYTATGGGWRVAIGALHYARAMRASPRASIVGALRAAATHCGDVIGPFTVVSLPADRWEVFR